MVLKHTGNAHVNHHMDYNDTKDQYQSMLRASLYPAIKKFIKDHQLVEINDSFQKKMVGFIRGALIGIFKDTDIVDTSYQINMNHNVILRKLNITFSMKDINKREYVFEFSVSI